MLKWNCVTTQKTVDGNISFFLYPVQFFTLEMNLSKPYPILALARCFTRI